MCIKVIPNKNCRTCVYKEMVYDERFRVNGEHYYCKMTRTLIKEWEEESECIDGYWYETGECAHYKAHAQH